MQNGNGTIVPGWLIKSLAWAFILGCLGWANFLTVKVSSLETDYSAHQSRLDVHETHFIYIKETLARIERKVDQAK